MTINQYLKDLQKCEMKSMNPGQPSFMNISMDSTEIWSNDACKGYMIKAAQSVGLDWNQIHHLLYAVDSAFNAFTADEAEKVYQNF